VYKLEKIVLDSLLAAAVKECDLLLAAVSGGADSTALLAALATLCSDGAERRFHLAALHVDHALRGDESLRDAAAAAALSENLNVPCRVVTAAAGFIEGEARRTGRGVEAAARDFRHKALREEAERLGARFIVIAHTHDDMLENTLLRALRGAGPAGLAAMPERNGRILRPLITVSRACITEYLHKRGLTWREDSSNADERYLRNRIRRRLVPLLDEHFSGWRQNIAALAETQALTAEFLGAEAERRIRWEPDGGGKLICPLRRFVEESQILREEAVFLAYDRIAAEKNAGERGVDAPPPASTTPRRGPVRNFARKIAETFGGVELEANASDLSASERKQKPLEQCTSILINKPGVYRFKNFSIECLDVPAAGSAADGKTSRGTYRFIVRENE
jgi:tRNA(Ile)-lysidine synthase